MKTLVILLFLTILAAGCNKNDTIPNDLSALPPDNGGTHEAMAYGATAAPFGYYIYTPGGYTENGVEYPLMVFLHGAGEIGYSGTDPAILDKILVTGIPELINTKRWHPSYPMIVVSPQCPERQWNTAKIHELIKFITEQYRVNSKRIYITGLSMGAIGTYSYIQDYGGSSYVAAAVPIAGRGDIYKGSSFQDIPVWAFHGDADPIVDVSNSISMIAAINDAHPAIRALLTIYPGVGHDSWSRTYDESGMGQESPDYDPFGISIFDWMLEYVKK